MKTCVSRKQVKKQNRYLLDCRKFFYENYSIGNHLFPINPTPTILGITPTLFNVHENIDALKKANTCIDSYKWE